MKPEWKDAPEWANYLAMDKDGSWYWFEKKPEAEYGQWNLWRYFKSGFGKYEKANPNIDWKKTLEHRQNIGRSET